MSITLRKMAVLLSGMALSCMAWAGISITLNVDAAGGERTQTFNSGATLKVNRLTNAPSWLTEAYLEPAGIGNMWVDLLSASGSSNPIKLHFTISPNTTGSVRIYTLSVLNQDNSVYATVTIKQTASSGSPTAGNSFGFLSPEQLKKTDASDWKSSVIIRATKPGNNDLSYEPLSSFTAGQKPYVHFLWANLSEVALSKRPAFLFEILNSSSVVVQSGNASSVQDSIPANQMQILNFQWDKFGLLSAGSYTLRVTIDPNKEMTDGDRSDNVVTYPFSVVQNAVSAPAAPTGVNTEALSTSSIRITWTAASGATSYKVYRAPMGHPELSDFVCIASGVTGVSYDDTGLSANTMYYYRVAACNASGETMCQYMSPCSTLQAYVPPSTGADFGFPSAADLSSKLGWDSAVCIYDAACPLSEYKTYNPLIMFEKGHSVCFKFVYVNFGQIDIPYAKCRAEILTDDYGLQVATSDVPADDGTFSAGCVHYSDWEWPALKNLPAGKYRLKITLDPNEELSDADRSDNTAVFKFVVTDPLPISQTIQITFHSNDSRNWNYRFSGFEVGQPLGNPSGLTMITQQSGFLGWFTAPSGGSQVSSSMIVTASMTDLYAHWGSNPVVDPVAEKKFGVGQASEFMVRANEKALVVGVSGLTWGDFALRAYKGQGWQDADKAGQSFYCFDDSRIMDVEKLSSLSSIDHNWCYYYADMQALLWGGYISGYTDVDELADGLRSAGDPRAYEKAITVYPTDYVWPNLEADKFVEDLVSAFSGCNARGTMDVLVDHQSGEREAASHSVSIVGYSLDATKPLSDPASLKGLFVIDSDNDMYNGQGGSSAPNSITYCPVSYEWYGGSTLMGLPAGYRFKIRNVFGTWGLVDSVWVVRAKTTPTVNKTVDTTVPSHSETGGSSGGGAAEPVPAAVVDVVEPEAPFAAPAAATMSGAVLSADGQSVAGVVQLKVGKEKNGESKVSVTIIGLDGKKMSSKAVTVSTGAGLQKVTFDVKGYGPLTLTLGADGFIGETADTTVVSVRDEPVTGEAAATFVPEKGFAVDNMLEKYLPKDVKVQRTAKKWTLPKAGKLKYDKKSGAIVETGDNIAGLKLTYNAKAGTLKGSFKIWTFDAAKQKLKSVSASVTGVVVDGIGFCEVTYRKQLIGTFTVE